MVNLVKTYHNEAGHSAGVGHSSGVHMMESGHVPANWAYWQMASARFLPHQQLHSWRRFMHPVRFSHTLAGAVLLIATTTSCASSNAGTDAGPPPPAVSVSTSASPSVQDDVLVSAPAVPTSAAVDTPRDLGTFLDAWQATQVEADRLVPTLYQLEIVGSHWIAGRIVGARSVDTPRTDEFACDGEEATATCIGTYAWAMVEYDIVVDDVGVFGKQAATAPRIGGTIIIQEIVGVVGTGVDDVDAVVEKRRDALVAAVPIGAVVAAVLGPTLREAEGVGVYAWALERDGMLTAMYPDAESVGADLWTDTFTSIDKLSQR
jgi:hypothetical protein